MKYNIWTDPDSFEARPEQIERILRCPSFRISGIDGYLHQIEQATGDDFSVLRSVTRDSPSYQASEEHLMTRRVIASFFSENAMLKWSEVLEAAISAALETLAAAREPDLMRDFVNPVFLSLMARIVGFTDDGAGRLFPSIAQAQRLTEPMLSLRDLRAINAALIYLLSLLPELDEAGQAMPDSLLAYLHNKQEKGPKGTDLRNTALTLLLASNSAAQSLGFALYGLLTGEAGLWEVASAPGWKQSHLDHVLSLYPSTLTLVRVAEEDIDLGGCPYARNHSQVMDIVKANAGLRDRTHVNPMNRERLLSFGMGTHKCPGEHLARLLIGAVIPALARRFPNMMLHKDKASFIYTPMMQAPVALPCELHGQSTRTTARLWDIKDAATARAIVNNDRDFSPPIMEPHLRALAAGGNRDLSQAIRIARNAMFFMSGERHAVARRAVAACMGGNRIPVWQGLIDAQIDQALDRLGASSAPDLIHDFADPVFRGITRPILGIHVTDEGRFDSIAPLLQDVLEPWLPMRELLRMQDIFNELLGMLQMPEAATSQSGNSVLASLIASDLPDFDLDDIKALVLVLYGASFNLSHTLGNVLHWILTQPPESRKDVATAGWISGNLEQLISLCASPKYIYRMARHSMNLNGLEIAERDTTRLQLLSINRGASEGHLAFGHGLHHCAGAALSRLMLRRCVPALFSRFPAISLLPQQQKYFDMPQTVAIASLPCRTHTPAFKKDTK